MSGWNNYMKTKKTKNDQFQLARDGSLELITYFKKYPAYINLKNEKGYSALMLAAYNGHNELTDELIALGADVNSNDYGGSSILMGCAFKGHKEIVRSLINNGAKIEHINDKGMSALDFAQMFGRSEVAVLIRETLHKPTSYSMLDSFKSWTQFFTLKGKKDVRRKSYNG